MKNKVNLNKLKIFYIIISMLLIVMGVVCVGLGFYYKNNQASVYSYIGKKSTNYEVVLNPNEFYTNSKIESGKYYASKSINSYLLNFAYNLKGNLNSDIKYRYNVSAELVGTIFSDEGEEKEIWSRNYTLAEDKEEILKEKDGFNIEKIVDIDYPYFNNLVQSYEKSYGISIDSVLKVKLNISYEIDSKNFNADIKQIDDFIELDIPITNTVSNVKEKYEDKKYVEIYSDERILNNIGLLLFVIGTVALITSFVIIILVIIRRKMTPAEKYLNRVKHILKYYSEIVVNIKNKPDLSNLKILYIDSIEDLIDIAQQNKTNIIVYHKNNELNAYILINDYAYVWNLQ